MPERDDILPAEPAEADAFECGRASQIEYVQQYISELMQSERADAPAAPGGFERTVPTGIHAGTIGIMSSFRAVRADVSRPIRPDAFGEYREHIDTIRRLIPGMSTNESADRAYRIGRRSLCLLIAGPAHMPDVDSAAEMIHPSRRTIVCQVCPVRVLCESKYNITKKEASSIAGPGSPMARTVRTALAPSFNATRTTRPKSKP